MKKKIIFFDGDGTLWYPKATKRTRKPHWVYHDEQAKDSYLGHLELTPGTKEVLSTLHERGVYLVVISAHPSVEDIALAEIKEKLDYFEISDYFYAYRASEGSNPQGKVAIMEEVIEKLNLTKDDAIMVGDSYFYDYLAPKEAGIDALFIQNEVSEMPDTLPTELQTISEIADLEGLIE